MTKTSYIEVVGHSCMSRWVDCSKQRKTSCVYHVHLL